MSSSEPIAYTYGLYCGDDFETIRAPYVEPDDGELAAFTMDGDAITRVLEAR